MKPVVNIFWFRRDLRLDDNAGLIHALKNKRPVVPVFIFDRSILDELEEKKDRRVEFIHQSLQEIQDELKSFDATLDVRYGFTLDVYKELTEEYQIEEVFTNHDYEPYAARRDNEIAAFLHSKGILFHSYKDQVIFEKNEVIKNDGKPYTVFTPYSKKWKFIVSDYHLRSYPTHKFFGNFYKQPAKTIPALALMGFQATGKKFPVKEWDKTVIENYSKQRDFPAIEGTSRLSVHLRFGTISIRKLVRETRGLNEIFLNELIWREFYQ